MSKKIIKEKPSLRAELLHVMINALRNDWNEDELEDLFLDSACTWGDYCSYGEKREFLDKIKKE